MGTSADTPAAPDESGGTRRTLLVGAIHAIWVVIAAALALPASFYLLRPPKARTVDDWIDVGDVTKLPPGEPVQMVFWRNRTDAWKTVSEKLTAWVVKTPERGVIAFGPQCTHLGCAYRWDDGKNQFICPCHNSLFSIDGKVLDGPAPRPLDRYDVKIQGGRLLLGSLRQPPENPA